MIVSEPLTRSTLGDDVAVQHTLDGAFGQRFGERYERDVAVVERDGGCERRHVERHAQRREIVQFAVDVGAVRILGRAQQHLVEPVGDGIGVGVVSFGRRVVVRFFDRDVGEGCLFVASGECAHEERGGKDNCVFFINDGFIRCSVESDVSGRRADPVCNGEIPVSVHCVIGRSGF